MVSSMSCSRACNSGVSNCVTGPEGANNSGSPILNTGLIIASPQLLPQQTHFSHPCPPHPVCLFGDEPPRCCPPAPQGDSPPPPLPRSAIRFPSPAPLPACRSCRPC